ncbi:MAG: tetratricopeptide repeat protein [Chlamydiales bacterium]|nr:tetratricopeptide repeat protein [Chlamydiales bacterium]
MDKHDDIIEIEEKGLEANVNGDFKLAAECFKKITEIDPDFEHGQCFYNLAEALEEIGEIDEAEKAYLKALEYYPDDYLRLGGYASFLYLHREPEKAFKVYLDLIRVYKSFGSSEQDIDSISPVFFTLGEKMGWSKEKVQKAIDEA